MFGQVTVKFEIAFFFSYDELQLNAIKSKPYKIQGSS